MRSGRVVRCAFVTLALAAPGTVQAARTKVADDSGSVRFAGDQVVWSSLEDGRWRLHAGRPGQKPRLLRSFSIPADADPEDDFGYGMSLGFATSASRLGTFTATCSSFHGQGPNVTSSTFDVGPIDGPYAQPEEYCGPTGDLDLGFDVDGDRLAFEECSRTFGDHRLIVRDLNSGERIAAIAVPGRLRGVRLAGDYVAYRYEPRADDAQIAVYDLARRQEAYRTPSTYWDFSGLGGQDFDVQADGKLARLTRVREPGAYEGFRACPQLEWFTRDDPTPHPVSGCPSGQVEMAGDRIAYSSIVSDRRGLVVADVRDGSVKPIITGAGFSVPAAGFDFDGSRLVYAQGGCSPSAAAIWIDDLRGGEEVVDPRCPVRIGRAALKLRKDGTTTVSLACERGCAGSVGIVRDLAREPVVGRHRFFTLRPGESRSIAIRIDSATRKLLRRRKSLRVRVAVSSETLAAARAEFRRRVTLRR